MDGTMSQRTRRTPRFPEHPANPDRICWGCSKLCPAGELACGNGTIRTPHPVELFGDDWLEWFEAEAPHTAGGEQP
jgi:hypothetical protein